MIRRLKPLVLLLLTIFITSCGKKLIYFQEREESTNKYNNVEVAKPEDPRQHLIEAGDILGLKINATTKDLADEFTKYSTGLGFVVQENGNIFLPYAGSIKISGKSVTEAESFIINELERFIVNPKIDLVLNSFRITILGEVKIPGIKNSPGDRMTIIDALSLSGDLGIDGNRKNIKVIRQTGDKKLITFMDISSVDVFKSPTYYLKSNDIIYVETLPKRYVRENITYVSVFLTIVNTLVIFFRI